MSEKDNEEKDDSDAREESSEEESKEESGIMRTPHEVSYYTAGVN